MGLNEQWGGLASRFAEAGVVEGCLVARSGAGTATVAPGILRLKKAVGVYHSPSIELQVGSATMAAGVAAPDASGFANGFYILYAHPMVDADNLVDGFELRYGGALVAADMAAALEAAEVTRAAAGTDIADVPEANYDASAFKMAASVPDSDFYKGRSVKLAIVQIAAGDIVAVDCRCAHRVR